MVWSIWLVAFLFYVLSTKYVNNDAVLSCLDMSRYSNALPITHLDHGQTTFSFRLVCYLFFYTANDWQGSISWNDVQQPKQVFQASSLPQWQHLFLSHSNLRRLSVTKHLKADSSTRGTLLKWASSLYKVVWSAQHKSFHKNIDVRVVTAADKSNYIKIFYESNFLTYSRSMNL